MRTKIQFFILSLVFIPILRAQQFSVKWSENLDKFSSGSFSVIQPVKSVYADNGTVISLLAKVQMSSTKYFLARATDQPDINTTLDLDESTIDGIFINLLKISNDVFILKYKSLAENNASILLQKINVKTLQLEKETFSVFDYGNQYIPNPSRTMEALTEFSSKIEFFDAFGKDRALTYSPDSTKILYKIELKQDKDNLRKSVFIVFDSKLHPLYSKEYEWKQPEKKIEVNNILLSNAGNVYVSYHIYEKDYKVEYSKRDGEKVPSYTTNLFILNKETQSTQEIPNQGKFLKDVNIGYDPTNHIFLCGLYKDIYNGGILGVFQSNSTMLENGEKINLQFFPFTDELLSAVDRDGFAKDKGSKKGLDYFYNLDHHYFLSNGSLQIILGYYKMRIPVPITPTNRENVIKGDIIVADIKGNESSFSRIPHTFISPVGATNFISSVPISFNGKQILLYLDREDNIEKDISKSPKTAIYGQNDVGLVAAIFGNDGKLQERKMLTTSKDSDHFVPDLEVEKIGEDKFIFYARRLKLFKLLTKIGLVSIK